MKKLIILLVLACPFMLAHSAPAADTTHTAYNDAKAINALIKQTPDILTNDSAGAVVSRIVLSYFKKKAVSPKALLEQNFSPKIIAIVERFLAQSDTSAIAQYIADNWKQIKVNTGVTLADYQKIETRFLANAAEKKILVITLQTLNAGKKIQNQRNLLKTLQSLRDTLIRKDSVNRAIDTTTLENKTTYKNSTSVFQALLKSGGFPTLDSLKIYVQTLSSYNAAYTKLTSLSKKIKKDEKVISTVFNADPDLQVSYYNSLFQGGGTVSVSDQSFQSIIGQSPQLPVFEQSSTATVAGTNNNNIETKAIDALAILLIQRVKQDVVLKFLQGLRNEVAKQPLIMDMFPNTIALLNEYPEYEIPSFGSVWSHAIAEDLINIPEHIADGNYLNSRQDIQHNPEFLIFKDVITIAKQVSHMTTISGLADYFANDPEELNNIKILFGFQLINMLDHEFITVDNGKASLIISDNVNELNDDELSLFLGLLSCKYPEVFNNFLRPFLPADQPHSLEIRKCLVNVLSILNGFQAAIVRVKPKDTSQNSVAASLTGASFWQVPIDLLHTLATSNIVDTTKKFRQFVQITQNCLNIYADIEQKNYSAMVHESLEVICEIIPEKNFYSNMLVKSWKLNKESNLDSYNKISKSLEGIDVILNGVHQLTDTAALKVYIDSIYAKEESARKLLVYKDKNDFEKEIFRLYKRSAAVAVLTTPSHNSFIYTLSRLGEFLTDVEKAKDSKELQSVIETYAVQPNSYIIKRNTRASISLNAFLGTYFGEEYAPALKPVFGLSAPIGLSFNWGLHKSAPPMVTDQTFIGRDGREKVLNGACFSINLTVVDIGAVVSYRINNGNDGALPKDVNLGQILAPGLSLSYGLKGIPLCFTLGTEFTPELRSLASSSQQQPAIRIYGGLFYDLPFTTFSKR